MKAVIVEAHGRAAVMQRDDIDTDAIFPGRFLRLVQRTGLGVHLFADWLAEGRPEVAFMAQPSPARVLVAPHNFGCGSSREHAVWALRGAGVKVVIARSYARIFFRNAINNGFLAIECPEAVEITRTGDEVEVDLAAGRLRNLTNRKEASFVPLSDFARELIEDGGLLPHIQKKAKSAA
jgi:3-isopropylmalate dehydratase small subunit